MSNDTQGYYYLDGENNTLGPCSLEELTDLATQGKIPATTYIAHDGWPEWKPWSQVSVNQLISTPPPPEPNPDLKKAGSEDRPSPAPLATKGSPGTFLSAERIAKEKLTPDSQTGNQWFDAIPRTGEAHPAEVRETREAGYGKWLLMGAGLLVVLIGLSLKSRMHEGVRGDQRRVFRLPIAEGNRPTNFAQTPPNQRPRPLASPGGMPPSWAQQPHALPTPFGPPQNPGGPVRHTGDGTGTAAEFIYPRDVAVDQAGNVYVADGHGIRKVTPDRVVTTLPGLAGSHVAVDNRGNVYAPNGNQIQKMARGGEITTITPSVRQKGWMARFDNPTGVAVDQFGNVHVPYAPGGSVQFVLKVSATGVGEILSGPFVDPQGIAVDVAGNVYVMASAANTVYKLCPSGECTALAGALAEGGGGSGAFSGPLGLAVDSGGNVYVADTGNHLIRKVSPTGMITTLAGNGSIRDIYKENAIAGGYADGPGSVARFNHPSGVAVDAAGNVYVADSENNAIRRITPAGLVTTLAGSPKNPGNSDGLAPAPR